MRNESSQGLGPPQDQRDEDERVEDPQDEVHFHQAQFEGQQGPKQQPNSLGQSSCQEEPVPRASTSQSEAQQIDQETREEQVLPDSHLRRHR